MGREAQIASLFSSARGRILLRYTCATATLTTLYTSGIWCGVMILEAIVLGRGFITGLLRKYPVFYSYIFLVLAGEILRFGSYRWQPEEVYAVIYWITQFIAFVFGSAVLFEVYQKSLAMFPGTARMARNILFLVFALLLAKSIVMAAPGGVWAWISKMPVDMERDLRIIQAIALIALIGLLRTYAIPVDRNLKGILAGYGLFVASGVVQLTLVSHFLSIIQTSSFVHSMVKVWAYAQPTCYLVVLGIWMVALWSYAPARAPMNVAEPAVDYEVLTSRTQRRFEKVSAELAKGVRP